MVRTQVRLPEQQVRRVRQIAHCMGISFSEFVRRCVSRRLESEDATPAREELMRAALAVAGRYRDPDERAAREHDRHLAEAFRG